MVTCHCLMELLGWDCPHAGTGQESGACLWSLLLAGSLQASKASQTLLSCLLHFRYLLFMKLAALQLMQQKASRIDNPTSLENGDSPSSASKPEDSPGPEAGSEEEGGSASGLAKVKELAETIASDDGTGGAAVDVGRAELQCCPCS